MSEVNVANVLAVESNADSGLNGKMLAFVVDEQIYAIPIECVIEIISVQTITVVPGSPPYVKGIINLRGTIIPVMDVRLRFNKMERDYDERTCIIVIEIKDTSVGLIVDRVLEVINVEEEQISPAPEFASIDVNKYIKHIAHTNDGVSLILDCETLINDENYLAISGLGE